MLSFWHRSLQDLWHPLWHLYFDILPCILSGIFSDKMSCILIGIYFAILYTLYLSTYCIVISSTMKKQVKMACVLAFVALSCISAAAPCTPSLAVRLPNIIHCCFACLPLLTMGTIAPKRKSSTKCKAKGKAKAKPQAEKEEELGTSTEEEEEAGGGPPASSEDIPPGQANPPTEEEHTPKMMERWCRGRRKQKKAQSGPFYSTSRTGLPPQAPCIQTYGKLIYAYMFVRVYVCMYLPVETLPLQPLQLVFFVHTFVPSPPGRKIPLWGLDLVRAQVQETEGRWHKLL